MQNKSKKWWLYCWFSPPCNCSEVPLGVKSTKKKKHQLLTHILKNQVYVLVVLSLQHVLELDDVFVVLQLFQKHNLTESSLGISCVLESTKNFLQSQGLLGFFVDALPDNAVGLVK